MFSKRRNIMISRILTIFLIVMSVITYVPSNFEMKAYAEETDKVDGINKLAFEAVKNSYNSYISGIPVDDKGYKTFTSYDAYVLLKAGIDIRDWKYKNTSFYEDINSLISSTISSEKTSSKSTAKRVAFDYISAKNTEQNEKAEQLLNILRNRNSDSGKFDSGTYAIYSNLTAYDVLAETGDLTSSNINIDNAVTYILDNQDNSTKAWPKEDIDNWIANDFMSTCQAVRILEAVKNSSTVTPSAIESAITGGMSWLKEQQQDDGSFIAGYDSSVTDTSEMIHTVQALGQDPALLLSSAEKSPADYILNEIYTNRSFGNISETIWVLDAYIRLGAEITKVDKLKLEAIKDNCESFISGIAVDGAGYTTFTSYDAYILMKAGMDINKLKYSQKSFSDNVRSLIEKTIITENTDSQSSAKRVAQDFVAAKALGADEDAEKLINILKNRQNKSGGFDSGTYAIYSNLPAYDILASEGFLKDSGIDMNNAVLYILNNQDTETKAWPANNETQYITNDFMSTAQSVRILKYAQKSTTVTPSAVEAAIDEGMTWLKGKQQDDGGFINGWDDSVTDTSEMIYTAKVMGKDPAELKNSLNKSPVDYMLNSAYADGSFGNISATTWALNTYIQLNNIESSGGDTDSGDNSENNSEENSFKVKIAVIGKDGDLIYGPRSVSVSEDEKFKCTAMGALDATGLSWKFGKTYGYIEYIDGQKNKGNSGWMYAVNGNAPRKLSIDKSIKSGDKIIWWYSESADAKVPEWPGSSSALSDETKDNEDLIKKLKNSGEKINDKNIILNSENIMTKNEAQDIFKELSKNKVSLTTQYNGDEKIMTDGEVAILMPDDLYGDKVSITVNELNKAENPKKFAVKIESSVYDFKPSGIKFDKSVTISIKVPIDENTDIDRINAAWFDEENNKWISIPSIIDLKTGNIIFKINHFTKFAVIESENRVQFKDVGDDISWAKDAVEILAGKGIISGNNNYFEPDRPITRAEFAKVIVKALGYDLNPSKGTVFNDVNKDYWFTQFVECAYDNNLIEGSTDGKFRPEDEISRNEIAVILGRLNENEENSRTNVKFNDASKIPYWAKKGVKFAVGNNLMKGYDDNTFKGTKSMTRAEAAVVLYRYLNLFNYEN